MTRYTANCVVCGRAFETSTVGARVWCSVGCQYAEVSPLLPYDCEHGEARPGCPYCSVRLLSGELYALKRRARALEAVAEAARRRLEVWTRQTYDELRDALDALDK